MKEIIKISTGSYRSRMAHLILVADLVLIAGAFSIGEAQSETINSVSEKNKVEKKEIRMDANDVKKAVMSLCHYEIDGSFLLSQAIENITNKNVQQKLVSFKDECEIYITELSNLIRKLGEEPPSHSRDFKGFFMQGYAAMRGLASDEGVLQALHTNTQTILNAYEEALRLKLPEDIKVTLQRIYDKKKELVNYIANQAIPKVRTAAAIG